MNRHSKFDPKRVKLHPIRERRYKISVDDFVRLDSCVSPFASKTLDRLAERIAKGHRERRIIIAMLGAHVIKCGLSLFIIDLLERKIISHVALNGAGAIHDFEIGLIGATSEYVEETLVDGSFGMAQETGIINDIVRLQSDGFGASVGKYIEENLAHRRFSILANAYRLRIPATVHVAIGTDIIHQHPNFDGAATGRATYEDFKIFVSSVTQLEGGVILNIGSAVMLPEVFLKAFSIARNLGHQITTLTAANLDMIDHYRPRVNVLERPAKGRGEKLNVIERHEKTIPYLYRRVLEKLSLA
ncbi:hypothetical protein AMJ40_02590 [candidate division TA06 bacterium DG_26]|uniref:Deoxyhypusine synthase n=1 Tax=candidate division TA06 bacterium DG_26 TaxID=1703771 RepID=A0A0S7WKF8_UNCT6|nr:MAG: hypothetical protein AMJ40_02590 [candidate division TA06 bacterium DG_26]